MVIQSLYLFVLYYCIIFIIHIYSTSTPCSLSQSNAPPEVCEGSGLKLVGWTLCLDPLLIPYCSPVSNSLQEALNQTSQPSTQVKNQPSRTPSQVTVLSTSTSLLARNGSAHLEGSQDKTSTIGTTSLQDDFGREHMKRA